MVRPGVLDHIAAFKRIARKPGSDEPSPVTLFSGGLAEVDGYQAAGVDRVLFWVRPTATQAMTKMVDDIALHLGPQAELSEPGATSCDMARNAGTSGSQEH